MKCAVCNADVPRAGSLAYRFGKVSGRLCAECQSELDKVVGKWVSARQHRVALADVAARRAQLAEERLAKREARQAEEAAGSWHRLAPTLSRRSKRMSELMQRVARVIEAHGGPVTARQYGIAIAATGDAPRYALRELVRAGLLVKERNKYGATVFRLAYPEVMAEESHAAE